MRNIVVLGAGLVGKAIILDLSQQYKVTAVDNNRKNLSVISNIKNVITVEAGLDHKDNIKKVIKNTDLVVGAIPGFMGFNVVKTVIETGKNIVDISFFPEDPFELDDLAKLKNVTAVVDCGVSPGLGNIILGYYLNKLDVDSYICYVGGLPQKPQPPWGYKAVFSPIDVIEEYTRPVRFRSKGKLKTVPALSFKKNISFENVGEFEAWNTDGLRTLLKTTNIPNLIEFTIRHCGTIDPIIALRDGGFFSSDKISINGNDVKPIDLTTKLLFSQWQMQPNDRDMTLMKIAINGHKSKENYDIEYDLIDFYDEVTATTSMARTTGYTCSAVVNLLLKNKYKQKGVVPPEHLGQDGFAYAFIINYLAERGVIIKKQSREL